MNAVRRNRWGRRWRVPCRSQPPTWTGSWLWRAAFRRSCFSLPLHRSREYFPQAGQAVRLQLPEPEFTRFWQAGRESLDEVLNFIAGWEENAPVSPDLFSSKGRS
jgi:hypothetical protein